MSKVALVLSGGGARGAYQAGAYKAIAEIIRTNNLPKFDIVFGMSAGAINAAYIVEHIDEFNGDNLVKMWNSLNTEQIYRIDSESLVKFLLKIGWDFLFNKKVISSLYDASPLSVFLEKKINFDKINQNIKEGKVSALGFAATNYYSNENITFYNSNSDDIKPWSRINRKGIVCELKKEHIMASASIPILFPPVEIDNDFYGDGCINNSHPLSPVIKLKAEKILIISTQNNKKGYNLGHKPAISKIIAGLINSLMYDAVNQDIERIDRENELISHLTQEQKGVAAHRKIITTKMLTPQIDLSGVALNEIKNFPKIAKKFFIGGVGQGADSSELISYLFFEKDYTEKLTQIGYKETIDRQQEIIDFLKNS